MKKRRKTLTRRQQVFVAEFIVCGNAAEAARRAGYSPNGAKQAASRLLTFVDLQRALEAARDDEESEAILRKAEALRLCTEIARTAEKPADRLKAIERLARMKGWDKLSDVRHQVFGDDELLRELDEREAGDSGSDGS